MDEVIGEGDEFSHYIESLIDDAHVTRQKALEIKNQIKEEYESKLKDVQKEAEGILSETRKKALAQEKEIVEEVLSRLSIMFETGEAIREINALNKAIEQLGK